MPPIFKMCPKPGCKRKLFEKKFFSKKKEQAYLQVQGQKAAVQKYECRRCMKYYENYLPSYAFMAEVTDPVSHHSIQIRFHNKQGQVLIGVEPKEFENALDFKNKNRQMEAEGAQPSRELEERLKVHKSHQKKIYNTRIYRQFLLLVRSDYFSPFNNNKQDHKLQFTCENIVDLSSGSDPRTFFYWNQINQFLVGQLHKYSRGYREQQRPLPNVLGDSQYEYFDDPDYIPPCDRKLKKKKTSATNQMWGDAPEEEEELPSQDFNVSDSQLRQWMTTQTTQLKQSQMYDPMDTRKEEQQTDISSY